VVLLNAAAALRAGEKVDSLSEGVELAARVIDDGKAREKLDAFVRRSGSL
jgi:anthranilate phosphoribosyltransferase